MNANNWKVLGIEESDGEHCECCGACCPKRRVVLTDGFKDVRFGVGCAAMKIRGNKTADSMDQVVKQGRAVKFAQKWLAKGEAPLAVAKAIHMRFSIWAEPRERAIFINGVGVVS